VWVLASVSAIIVMVGLIWIARGSGMTPQSDLVTDVGVRPSSAASESVPSATGAPSVTDVPDVSSLPEPALFPVPRRVSIPSLDVDARIVPVGLEADGAIEIPDDVDIVGWYELGVPPGADRGSAVLVAHRDGRDQGQGVFYDLGAMDLGDRVRVRDDAGDVLVFEVVARESLSKKGLPYDELFAANGPPRLTLISCGGEYDADRGGYQDNVIVTAVPLTRGA
jgi:sortase (surface protein transpeptidase)